MSASNWAGFESCSGWMDVCLTTSPASNGHIEVIHDFTMSVCCRFLVFVQGACVEGGALGFRGSRTTEPYLFQGFGVFLCAWGWLSQHTGPPFIA